MSKSTSKVFKLSAGTSYHLLFLGGPRNKRRAKINTKTIHKPAINGAGSPQSASEEAVREKDEIG